MKIQPRGIVQKNVFEPYPRTLWLKHNPALFSEDEWIWSEHRRDAFIFPTFEKAEEARALLVNNGEEHVFPVVHRESPAAAEIAPVELPPARCSGGAKPSPEECFEALEKRNLA